MASMSFTIRRAFREVEPTGDACAECGDAMYLREFRMQMRIGEAKWKDSGVSYCESCMDLLSDGD